MKPCIFVGPTLHEPGPAGAVDGFDVFEPARLGSVFQAVQAGYRRIGIVDGYFGNTAPVWHKEILYAMAQGARVWGSSSMGALRAAELARYGMQGIGVAFRLFSAGALNDDDEVCLVHASREFRYRPLSMAMLNLRFTLRRLVRTGLLTQVEEQPLIAAMKGFHFSQRTRGQLARIATGLFGGARSEAIGAAVRRHHVDIKRRDCQRLIRAMLDDQDRGEGRPERLWSFPNTSHWHQQFTVRLHQLPPLARY